MRILNLLNTPPADSLNHVQAEIAAVAQKIATTPTDELIGDFLEKLIYQGSYSSGHLYDRRMADPENQGNAEENI